MTNTLVYEILSGFSKEEFRAFGVFLQSPYYNRRMDLIRANRVFTAYLSKGRSLPDKAVFFKKVFPGEQYDGQKLRLTLSRLYKLLEKFIILTTMEQMPLEAEKLLITAYRKRKLRRNYERSIRKIKRQTEQLPFRTSDFHFQHYHIEYQNYLRGSDNPRSKSLNLEKVEQHLDLAYFSAKLRQACFTLSHQAVSNIQYHPVLLTQIMQLAQQKPYKDEPAISLYYRFILLFQEGDIEKFGSFRKELFAYKKHFSQEEFRDIYLLALNFCIRKINQNEKPFFQETLNMYKKGLDMELLLEQGQISRFTYNNIVAIALNRGDLEWVDGFIKTYSDHLNETYREATYHLNLSRLAFAKKDFKDALSHLQKTDHDDLISHMTAKILQMKIYYELREFDSLDYLIQSLRIFIQRKKRIGYHYHLWRNILKYTQKLSRVNPYDKAAINRLKTQIREEALLPEREWLLAKLEVLR